MTKHGFTLVEMVVVLVILASVMLLVLPLLPSTDTANLRNSARTLAATMRYLEARGIAGKTNYRLHFNLGDNTVRVMQVDHDGVEAEPDDTFLRRTLLAERVTIKDVVIPPEGRLATGETAVTFGPAGLTEFVSVHLATAKGSSYTVNAYPSSGKVKVFEGYQEEIL